MRYLEIYKSIYRYFINPSFSNILESVIICKSPNI